MRKGLIGVGGLVLLLAFPMLRGIQEMNKTAPASMQTTVAPTVASTVAPAAIVEPTAPTAPTEPAAPAAPAVRIGPTFREVDSYMDGRSQALTEAQREDYWNHVSGTQVTWEGQAVEVETTGGGRLTLRCNPKTFGSDTIVNLDGSQLDRLASISKGQRVVFRGILQSHGMGGYTISQARFGT